MPDRLDPSCISKFSLMTVTEKHPSIEVSSLSYEFPDGSSGLHDVVLRLPPGSRTLLIGGTSLHVAIPVRTLMF